MTLPELEKKLADAKVPAAMYSLDGSLANGTYCIDRAGNEWEIYYASGGKKTVIDTAATLEGAYDSFWNAVSIKMEFHKIKLPPRGQGCAVCSDEPTITELIDYEQVACDLKH